MKLKLAAILLLAIAGCASAPPLRPEPLEVGANIFLLKRDEGRPRLEWADGLKIAEDFCQRRQEGKAEIMLVTEPNHIAFKCELGMHDKLEGSFRVFRAPSPQGE